MIPLSFAQQRLWFLDQLEPGSSAYNVPLLLRVEGRLEEATLARSLEEIVRRHEPLRTIFRPVEGEPEQVILPPGPVAIVWCDMRAERAEERDSLALRHARGEAMKPFDLARGPMIRFHVWRTGEEAYLLLVTMHHIASDGWSIGVFLTEMVALYDAFIEGKPSPLPEPAIRYAEYAAEQRSRLQGDLLERHAEYWKRQLTGAPSLLDLPLDFTRPAVQSTRGAQQSVEIPRELTDALKALSRKHNVTLFMTLLAAFETLLHRHSGQEDFLLGVPIAGRVRAETQGLIGFFVNTLAMRADFSGDPTLAELLRRVRRTSLESFEYQDLPFDRLVEELRPERNPAFNPLVQAMFAFENAPMPGSGAHALTLHPVRIESGTTKFDLTLTLYDEGELKGFFEYATDLFDPATIARMEGHFLTLLWGIVGDPERPVSRLPLLTEAERRTLLIEWNPQEIPPPPAATVQSLFEAQAARTPEAEALSFGGRRLTYGELNRWANRIARDLRGAGAGPEVPVVLCMSRSLEMIVAVIAIFKSGGAFVPVEPDIPRDRLAFILGETQAAVILTQESIASALPGGNARVMCIESSGPPEEPGAGANLVHEVAPDTLAYIIYTSGSTGTPKGVEITHGALAEHALETIGRYGLSGRDRVLQFSSLSFDASLEQYIPPLIAGG
ncbi:MAG TPA: condensation domain-containing protein, partial [Bacteroidota bacterium]|nr:condensation domain-containing protein [Bacteroidota bacterium]